jgi:hypothetical protein
MKALIAIVNAHCREEFADTVRSTWVPKVPNTTDVKFFRGRGAQREPKEDEVFLDCDDTYLGLPDKVRSIVRWAYNHGYDYVLKCDDDVVLKPVEMLVSGFDRHDFTGSQDPKVVSGEIRTPWGFCYWLSRKAMKLVVDAPLPGEPGSTHSYVHNNDEAWVSTVLYVNGIFLNNDQRYFLYRGKVDCPRKDNPRALRRHKERPYQEPYPVGTFAWCLYIDAGLHHLPAHVILTEFRKIFEENK